MAAPNAMVATNAVYICHEVTSSCYKNVHHCAFQFWSAAAASCGARGAPFDILSFQKHLFMKLFSLWSAFRLAG